MTNDQNALHSYVFSLLEEGHGREHIETQLLEKGHEEGFAKEFVLETQKQRNAVRRAQGLNMILAGGAICFASFLLTITSTFTHGSFPYVLYGLTSVGIVVGFTGFMKVF